VSNERKVIEVHVDRGMKDGQTVVFAGEADQAPGTIPGDVVIVIEEKPHETFKRKGDDLYTEHTVDLLTALAGGHFSLPHVADKTLKVHVLPGEILKPGSLKVLKEQGMPSYRHHELGDLYVHFSVDFPETLPEQSFALLEQALPPRTLPTFPKSSEVEEAYLSEADHAKAARRDADAMDEDEDDPRGGQGVSCQQS